MQVDKRLAVTQAALERRTAVIGRAAQRQLEDIKLMEEVQGTKGIAAEAKRKYRPPTPEAVKDYFRREEEGVEADDRQTDRQNLPPYH